MVDRIRQLVGRFVGQHGPASDDADAVEEGQGLAEYALILALIAIVAIVALIFLGTQVSSILSSVGDSM